MEVIAIANIKFGKLKISGVTLDPNDTNYYKGFGDTVVHIVDGKVNGILSPCDDFREEHIMSEGGKLYSRYMGMYVSGNYPAGEYVVKCPSSFVTTNHFPNCLFWPTMPDGTELVSALSIPMDLGAAVERGQLFGKLEDEVSMLPGASNLLNEYLDVVQELLSDAPDYYKNNQRPLFGALSWALAQRKGTM